MDITNFQLTWQNSLSRDFLGRVPQLFLEATEVSEIMHRRLHPFETDSVVSSQDSRATLIDAQTAAQTHGIKAPCFVIRDSQQLREFKDAPYRTKFFSIGHTGISWSEFNITQDQFNHLLSGSQLANSFRNLISHMAGQQCDEIAPPIPYWKRQTSNDIYEVELGYALRYPVRHDRSNVNPWSIRQFAVHFTFQSAVENDEACWLSLALPESVVRSMVSALGRVDMTRSVSSAYAHMYVFEQTLFDWRLYVDYLHEEISKCIGTMPFAAPDGEAEGDLPRIRMRLRNLENQLEDTRVSISSNRHALLALDKPFSSLNDCLNGNAVDQSNNDTLLAEYMQQHIHHSDGLLSQLDALQNKLASCTEVASNFLELSNGKTLRDIAMSSAQEAHRTTILTEQNHRDATTVKALTIIASIFLPTTVVLNFFSTEFVQGRENDIRILDDWWLLLAIGIPLTCIVLAIWAIWTWLHLRRLKKQDQPHRVGDKC